MSKIIKAGKAKVLCFDLHRGLREEESFNPLGALLPEDLSNEEKEEVSTPDCQEPASQEEALVPPAEETEKGASPAPFSGEDHGACSFRCSELSLEELLQHPEVSAHLAQLEQEAYEKGFQQGQRDGEALGRKKYETLASRLEKVLQGLEAEIENHVLSLEPQVLSLLKEAVKCLINKEVELAPGVLENSLREALSHVVEQARVKIHLNPADLEFIEEVVANLGAEFSKLKDFEIVPDHNLARGGCLLETDFGLVDATLERKWREFLQKLSA